MKLTHTHTPVHQHQPLSWAHIKVNTHFIQCHTSLQQNTKTSVLLQYTYISMCYHSNKSNSWWTTEIAIRGWKAGDTDVQGETGMLGSICPPSSVSVSGINWPFHNQVIVEGTIYVRARIPPPKGSKDKLHCPPGFWHQTRIAVSFHSSSRYRVWQQKWWRTAGLGAVKRQVQTQINCTDVEGIWATAGKGGPSTE